MKRRRQGRSYIPSRRLISISFCGVRSRGRNFLEQRGETDGAATDVCARAALLHLARIRCRTEGGPHPFRSRVSLLSRVLCFQTQEGRQGLCLCASSSLLP